MNSELKQTIKNEIAHIIEDIKYEELMFNKVFKSNVEFQKSYLKLVWCENEENTSFKFCFQCNKVHYKFPK